MKKMTWEVKYPPCCSAIPNPSICPNKNQGISNEIMICEVKYPPCCPAIPNLSICHNKQGISNEINDMRSKVPTLLLSDSHCKPQSANLVHLWPVVEVWVVPLHRIADLRAHPAPDGVDSIVHDAHTESTAGRSHARDHAPLIGGRI